MIYFKQNAVIDIRLEFAQRYIDKKFVNDKSGSRMLEIIGANFIADKDSIFGKVNHDYVKRELEWYESQSLYVKDIPGQIPKIWEQVACKNGKINSNYGYLIWSKQNNEQYQHVVEELKKNVDSRRAIMIYTRPSIWNEYNQDGRSDFICTNAVQYLIRDNKLHAIVSMRSNDTIFGYRNDWHWQNYVLNKLANDLNIEPGDIYWNVGSLHVYEAQFYLVDHFCKTGETHIMKADYDKLYALESKVS